jgi:hypothetical protein
MKTSNLTSNTKFINYWMTMDMATEWPVQMRRAFERNMAQKIQQKSPQKPEEGRLLAKRGTL